MTANLDSNAKTARRAWLRALERTAAIDRSPEVSLPVLVSDWSDRYAEATALVSPQEALSYRDLARRAHRYAHWGIERDLRAGDTVCLLMANCPEYLAVWLGLSRLRVSVALINTHLTGEALVHSIGCVAPKLVIVGADLAAPLAAVRERLAPRLDCWVLGAAEEDFLHLGPQLALCSPDPLSAGDWPLPRHLDTALYIYTSGTTGLPKAARVSHYRLMQWSHWFAGMLDVQPADRMYDCLPLYHSVGGVVATGALLVSGGTVEIRARFSAGDFWRDVSASGATLFQYIGELCRYLVNAPERLEERQHGLRLACGNGLRPEVWEAFQSRFRIPRILEYYASTEGNFSLYNCEAEPGAIGRIPAFLAASSPVALVRFDVEAGAPARDAAGFCMACAANEVGEALGLIQGERPGGRFEGYADREASERKVLRDVFTAGDAWYRTGDLMRRDERGFYYFVDRVGETFRWKGENVSTAEVLSVLTSVAGVLEGVVYGVQVPHADGRAGMAAIVVADGFDLPAFHAAVSARLPGYARPVFLRLIAALEATGTFKPKRQDLVQAGFDPARIADRLYMDDPRARAYVPLDAVRYAALLAGDLRL